MKNSVRTKGLASGPNIRCVKDLEETSKVVEVPGKSMKDRLIPMECANGSKEQANGSKNQPAMR